MARQSIMKGNRSYIIYLSIALGLFVLVKLTEPRGFDWTPTCDVQDKNPYGAWVLGEVMPAIFPGHKITYSNRTPYELKDSLTTNESLFILAPAVNIGKEDTEALLNHVEKGGIVFISAESIWGKLADTLRFRTTSYLFENGIKAVRADTSYLQFPIAPLDTNYYSFAKNSIHHYFGLRGWENKKDSLESIRIWNKGRAIAVNEYEHPVTIRRPWGKGYFLLNSTPLVFSNINILQPAANAFASTSLSYLPQQNIRWMEYYSAGRREAVTPLRFILRTPPLTWAYYISVLTLLVFMIFEGKRRQRTIPILPPLQNTSMEFTTTLGNLYYQRGDHRDIAEKKILYFFDQMRQRYHLNPVHRETNFFELASRKTGHTVSEVTTLFKLIDAVLQQKELTAKQLIDLNHQMEKFFDTHNHN
ncbi:MAG TPA: DUF4350 domain-containing protein [Cyclobacteriaceae bacterium]|jgi:hypothetical protein|nr:DUF4350 domain-containing protein [Cyclobacteriaceae bacterium]